MKNTGRLQVKVRKDLTEARLGRVCRVKFCDEFRSMSEFRSEYPRGFLISTLITCPTDKI